MLPLTTSDHKTDQVYSNRKKTYFVEPTWSKILVYWLSIGLYNTKWKTFRDPRAHGLWNNQKQQNCLKTDHHINCCHNSVSATDDDDKFTEKQQNNSSVDMKCLEFTCSWKWNSKCVQQITRQSTRPTGMNAIATSITNSFDAE